ncbi:hypothetical protein MBLNU230_g2797t1 [Neophaeotheca triangularis]
MPGLRMVEDRPTPKSVYNWRVYWCAIIASFAACTIGYDSAFIGTTLALPSFENEFGFNEMSESGLNLIKSNIVSVYQAGAFFGAGFAYISAHYIGRQRSLMFWAIVFVLGAGLTLGPTGERGLGLMYAGRVITGLGVGATSMVTPIYISEISPPSIRGRLVGLYELGWQLGGLCGFWINYGLERNMAPTRTQWQIPFAIQLIPSGLLLFGAFLVRESPRWLLSKDKRSQAIKNLCWIRQLPEDHTYILEEVAVTDQALEEQRSTIGEGFWAPFKATARDRKIQWRLILGGFFFLFQNGSGINAINYYSPTVFASIGITGTSTAFLTTGIFGVVKTVGSFIWLYVMIDHLGRRNLLLIGAAGGSVCMWIIGGYLAGTDPTAGNADGSLSSGGIAAVFFFYLWTAFYTASWNGTPWVLNGEIHSPATRGLGQASASMNNWFWNFIISRFTPQMFSNMGKSGFGVFMFFASMMVVSIVFVWYLVPETKGVPLEQMDRLFEVKPARKANDIVLAEYREKEQNYRYEGEEDGDGVLKKQTESTVENV